MNTIEIGGRALAVRPSSLGTTRRWMDAQAELRLGTREYLAAISDFVYESLLRGNPELDRGWLEDNLDETNLRDVIRAIYEAGGIKTQGEPERPTSP